MCGRYHDCASVAFVPSVNSRRLRAHIFRKLVPPRVRLTNGRRSGEASDWTHPLWVVTDAATLCKLRWWTIASAI